MNIDTSPQHPPVEILLAEDSEPDVILTRKCFQRSSFNINLHNVENGEECLAFLRKRGRYTNAPTPDLLLLDLNMPLMDGRETLLEINKDAKLNQLPVIILTTSEDERDILSMYKLGCRSYITKPVDFIEFNAIMQKFCDYWFTVVNLPRKGN